MAKISSSPPPSSRPLRPAVPLAVQPPPSASPKARRKKEDEFEGLRSSLPLAGEPPIASPSRAPLRVNGGAIHLLDTAREPGVFFRLDEDDREGQRRDEDEDPELAAAVEECIRQLFGVHGIERVGPGKNDSGETVIVITPMRGFSEASLRAIPERIHRFPTLVVVPFDLLPLRREL